MIENDNPICVQCGVEYGGVTENPERCDICTDERQYVRWEGQAWTTQRALRDDHHNRVAPEGPGLLGIGTEPKFGIGQRALLVPGSGGNVLWDCLTLLDEDTIAVIREQGGLDAIALSHPHYYGSMMTWSQTFGDIPVYVHRGDARWVPEHEARSNVVFWDGKTCEIAEGITLVHTPVHFAGGTVLHWADGADGAGALLTGDIFQVVMDRRHVGFMYSYPNLIPESPAVVREAVAGVRGLEFADIYGAWWERNIRGEAKEALERSADRYLAHIQD